MQSIVRVTASEPTLEWTDVALHAAQELDEDLQPVIRWLSLAQEGPTKNEVAAYGMATCSYVKQWKVFRCRNGVLKLRWKSADGLIKVDQLIVTRSHRQALIRMVHE